CSVLAVERVPKHEVNRYGIVETRSDQDGTQWVTSIVEKPHPDATQSNLAVVGRYILTPAIFDKLIVFP
ncbi:UTP--glucose-1-phosphate uridylyltransferase, partial [Achromatium sp. WMS3]